MFAGFLWYAVVTQHFTACSLFLLLRCSSSCVLSFEPLRQRPFRHWVKIRIVFVVFKLQSSLGARLMFSWPVLWFVL